MNRLINNYTYFNNALFELSILNDHLLSALSIVEHDFPTFFQDDDVFQSCYIFL